MTTQQWLERIQKDLQVLTLNDEVREYLTGYCLGIVYSLIKENAQLRVCLDRVQGAVDAYSEHEDDILGKDPNKP